MLGRRLRGHAREVVAGSHFMPISEHVPIEESAGRTMSSPAGTIFLTHYSILHRRAEATGERSCPGCCPTSALARWSSSKLGCKRWIACAALAAAAGSSSRRSARSSAPSCGTTSGHSVAQRKKLPELRSHTVAIRAGGKKNTGLPAV